MTLKWRLEDPLRSAKDAHLIATPTPTSAVPGVSLRLSAASRSKFRDPDAESAYRNLPLVLAGVLASRDSPTPLTFFHAFETIVKHWTVKMPEFRAPKIFLFQRRKHMNTIRGSFRAAVLMAAAASVLALAGGAKAQDSNPNDNTWPYATTHHSPVLAVVGDISCQPDADALSGEKSDENCTTATGYLSTSLWQSQEATANQIEAHEARRRRAPRRSAIPGRPISGL